MPYFKAKMHQILPQTSLGELTALSPNSLAGFKGPTSKGKDGKGKERGKGKGTGRGQGPGPTFLLVYATPL